MAYRQIEHTADIALLLDAESEVALFAEGARAVVEILTEQAPVAAREERRVEFEALDPEDRLVRWLNEVLVLAIVDGFLLAEATIELRGETGLRAHCRGERAPDRIRTELKSVTYHDVAIDVRPGRCHARVVVDV